MNPNLMLLLQYQAVIVDGLARVGGLIAAAIAGQDPTDAEMETARQISIDIQSRGDAILAQDQQASADTTTGGGNG